MPILRNEDRCTQERLIAYKADHPDIVYKLVAAAKGTHYTDSYNLRGPVGLREWFMAKNEITDEDFDKYMNLTQDVWTISFHEIFPEYQTLGDDYTMTGREAVRFWAEKYDKLQELKNTWYQYSEDKKTSAVVNEN